MTSDEYTYEASRLRGFIEMLAYQLWEKRGRPLGSPEQDWFRAEQVFRHHLGLASPHGLAFPPLSAVLLEPNNE